MTRRVVVTGLGTVNPLALDTPNYDFGRIVWAANGEHLTRESFTKYRSQGGVIVQIGGADANLYPIFRDSIVMVASDAVQYVEHRGNPRLAGTFARVLGRFSREQSLFPLMEALRRMTIMPAERLQRMVPAMARMADQGRGRCRPHGLRPGDGHRSGHH